MTAMLGKLLGYCVSSLHNAVEYRWKWKRWLTAEPKGSWEVWAGIFKLHRVPGGLTSCWFHLQPKSTTCFLDYEELLKGEVIDLGEFFLILDSQTNTQLPLVLRPKIKAPPPSFMDLKYLSLFLSCDQLEYVAGHWLAEIVFCALVWASFLWLSSHTQNRQLTDAALMSPRLGLITAPLGQW